MNMLFNLHFDLSWNQVHQKNSRITASSDVSIILKSQTDFDRTIPGGHLPGSGHPDSWTESAFHVFQNTTLCTRRSNLCRLQNRSEAINRNHFCSVFPSIFNMHYDVHNNIQTICLCFVMMTHREQSMNVVYRCGSVFSSLSSRHIAPCWISK